MIFLFSSPPLLSSPDFINLHISPTYVSLVIEKMPIFQLVFSSNHQKTTRMFRNVLRNAARTRVGVRMQSSYARGPQSTRILYGAGAGTAGLAVFSMFSATISNDADAKKVKKEKEEKVKPKKDVKKEKKEKKEEKKEEKTEEKEENDEKKDEEKAEEKDEKKDNAEEKEGSSEDSAASSEDGSQSAAFNPETGEINWDCPCLGGMAHGPCGEEFKEAFSCFIYSETEPKGIDCITKFENMRSCFKQYPEHYREELYDDETEEELVDVSEKADGVKDLEKKEVENKATAEAKTQAKSEGKDVPNTKPNPEVKERVEKKAPKETKA